MERTMNAQDKPPLSFIASGIKKVDEQFQKAMEALYEVEKSINQFYYHAGRAQGIADCIELSFKKDN